MTEASEDVIPTSSNMSNQTVENFNDPEITIKFENPNHQPSTSVDDTDVMETVITEITNQTQTFINPHPSIHSNFVLRSVCIEIFESLLDLVEDRIKLYL